MRTTLTIDDDVAAALKERAYRTGRPFKHVVNETLRAGIVRQRSRPGRRYRLKPASLGNVVTGADLTKALRLAEALEDDELVRKLELRK